MATVILVGLTIVLVLAAAYVGLLLLRRSRAAASAGPEQPRTVGDLVRRRSGPGDVSGEELSGADLSGEDLFAVTEPRRDAAAAPDGAPDPATRTTEVAAPAPPQRQLATPAGGVEVGDAPWRRAARMMGAEPGAGWDTAPIPVVPAPAAQPDAAARTAVLSTSAAGTDRPAVARPVPVGASAGVGPVEAAPRDVSAEPALAMVAPAFPEGRRAPIDPEPATSDVNLPATVAPVPGPDAEAPAAESDGAAADVAPAPDAPSRPLSDPDLTPLMGIPVIRPLPADADLPAPADPEPAPLDALPPVTEPAAEPAAEPDAGPEILPAPPRAPDRDDDEVVWMVPAATTTAPLPVVVSGSPQPVWFRVVRRDGEPVAAAVVALLDPHGREVDATKTATDGGGELRAPHGGHFLMIASADGFQPRAVLLTVEEKPVELALLLPRSATLVGAVRDGADAVPGAWVVARQEGEVVDESTTGPDGGYRFDDLAEGVYTLTATDRRGTALRRVTLSESTDLRIDLDLTPPGSAR